VFLYGFSFVLNSFFFTKQMATAIPKSIWPIAGLWATFAGTHVVLSHPPVRAKLVEDLGPAKFQGVYSAVAFASLGPLVYLHARRAGTGPLVHTMGNSKVMRVVAGGIKTLGALTFTQAVITPSPLGMPGVSAEEEPKGLLRITRHPLFMAFALWGLGNVLVRGALADVVFWGGFPTFWVLGSMHQDFRKKQTLSKEFFDKTSLLPFKAIIEGRNSFTAAMQEMSLPGAAAGVGLAAALYLAPRFLRR
jgi:uncharacterized membrane protein